MISAGMPPPAKPSLSSLIDERRNLEGRIRDLNLEASKIGESETGERGNAKIAADEAAADVSYFRQDENTKKSEERAREQAVEAAKNKQEEYLNTQIKTLAERLNVSEQKIRAAWDLANFYKEKFEWDIKAAIQQAVIEIFCDNLAAQAEIIRVLHAVSVKMNDALLGTRTSASGIFDPKRYLRVTDPIRNAYPEQAAAARSQQREHEAEREQLRRLENDPYYANEIKEAENKHMAARADHSKAGDELDEGNKRKEKMAQAYKEHRAKRAGILEQLQPLTKRMSEIEAELEKRRSRETAPATAGRRRPARAAGKVQQGAVGGPTGGATDTPSPAQTEAERRLRAIGIKELSAGQIPEGLAAQINGTPNTAALRLLLKEMTKDPPPAAG